MPSDENISIDSPLVNDQVTLITSIHHDHKLLPHFIEYYRKLGIRRFILGLMRENLCQVEAALVEFNNTNIELFLFDGESLTLGELRSHRDTLRKTYVKGHEWWIPADLDELHQYPIRLDLLVAVMNKNGFTHCSSRFVDRVADGGLITPTLPAPSIFQQYPWEVNVTEKIVKGFAQKVCLCRGDVSTVVGHHRTVSRGKCWQTIGHTHHFKWRAGIIEHLRERMNSYREHGLRFWRESQRLLDYYEKNHCFDLASLEAIRGWCPY